LRKSLWLGLKGFWVPCLTLHLIDWLGIVLAIAITIVLGRLLVLLSLWFLVSLVVLYGTSRLLAIVATLLLAWLKIISMSLRKRVVLDGDLYLSFVHVRAAANPNPIYEVGLYLQDVLGLLDAVEFDKAEALVFARRRVLEPVGRENFAELGKVFKQIV